MPLQIRRKYKHALIPGTMTNNRLNDISIDNIVRNVYLQFDSLLLISVNKRQRIPFGLNMQHFPFSQ